METIQNLLVLYAGLLLINCVLSAALWLGTRERLYRLVFFVWATTVFAFVTQGALAGNHLLITLGFSASFLVNLALANLVAKSRELELRWQPFTLALGVALLAAVVLFLAGASFTLVALPVSLAVAAPCVVTATRVIRAGGKLSTSMKALLASSLLFSAHNIDFAFLRDNPALAPLGFTVAILIIFMLSVTAHAFALEQVTAERARIATEMETTRRIQTRLLPNNEALDGFDLVSHVRPADSVGGDYIDVYQCGADSWLLLGDVTGHGIGAGLVMLMAQSTISTILHLRPDLTPRELNYLANRVLARNLTRLGEKRHMTVATVHSDRDGRLSISGSHDNIYVLRAASGDVETIELSHFPLGLGFYDGLALDQFGEHNVRLEAGDLLFIGSDGVTEAARDGDLHKGVFGEEALKETLRENALAPVIEVRRALLQKLEQFTHGIYHDDVSFLILRTVPRVAEVVTA